MRCCPRSAARPRSTSRSSSPRPARSTARRRADRRRPRRDPPRRGPARLPRGDARGRAPGAGVASSSRRSTQLDECPLPGDRAAGVHARRHAAAVSPHARRARAARSSSASPRARSARCSSSESLAGWQEFELEVMCDSAGNCVVVCSIENLDPMGVHTGDSWTVAPQQTLTDAQYQRLREAAFACARTVGVATGGANVQFAVRPGDAATFALIEMNPRVSRSSALASKATGFPIAKLAALLAVGYTLDELPNDITGRSSAAFEPALDYVAVKAPRFDFEKFPSADRALGTEMRAVGESLGLGRTFPEALLKALEGRRGGSTSCPSIPGLHPLLRGRARVDPRGGAAARRDRRRAGREALRPAGRPDRARARPARGGGARAPRCARPAGGRLLRRRVRGPDALLLPLARAGRSGRGAERPHRAHPRLGPEPDRPGDRVRLLLHARRAGVPAAGVRGRAAQLQPGDGLDRLRHLRPALPGAA